ncbi:MAG: hypothetical protein LBE53_09660 [Paucimonas sp.]|jgi:hypothetical protein|nr:hypothetical protein [Paucimonas sp.]
MMKYIACSVVILLGTSLAAAAGTQLPHEESVSRQESNVGNIVIYDKEKERSCSLQPKAGENEVYRFGSGKTCTSLPNDEAYYFKIDGVPSAVLVTFYDSSNCSSTGNFIIKVRTMQSPTTTEPIKLSTAHSKPVNEILAPGLRLEDKAGSGQVDGKLSCVRIEY